MGNKYQYKKIVLGGTFDHFHKGHKKFLEKAFELGEEVLIGITSDAIIKNKFLSSSIDKFEIRKKNILRFLVNNNWNDRVKIIKINDCIGGVDKLDGIEAIIVSRLTQRNALKINQLRVKNGLKKLKIIIVADILASDGKIISSERIRKGEIDRNGESYWLFVIRYFEKKEKLTLPENLKEELRKPLGKIFSNSKDLIKFIKEKKPEFIFSIGDIVSYHLIKNKINPQLLIFDFKTKRGQVSDEVKKVLSFSFSKKIVNQPGTISKNAFLTIKTCVEKILSKNEKQQIFVDGEEDLLALPSILFSPLKTLVLYGHWRLGVIGVEVKEMIKEKVVSILKNFER